jgi:hypothetical protein
MRRHYSTGDQQSHSNGEMTTRPFRPKSATLPSCWSIEVDSESGRTFYFNNETNESTWRPPSTCSTSSESQSDVCLLILPNLHIPLLLFWVFDSSFEHQLLLLNTCSHRAHLYMHACMHIQACNIQNLPAWRMHLVYEWKMLVILMMIIFVRWSLWQYVYEFCMLWNQCRCRCSLLSILHYSCRVKTYLKWSCFVIIGFQKQIRNKNYHCSWLVL